MDGGLEGKRDKILGGRGEGGWKLTIQSFIDHFKEHELYNTFTDYGLLGIPR